NASRAAFQTGMRGDIDQFALQPDAAPVPQAFEILFSSAYSHFLNSHPTSIKIKLSRPRANGISGNGAVIGDDKHGRAAAIAEDVNVVGPATFAFSKGGGFFLLRPCCRGLGHTVSNGAISCQSPAKVRQGTRQQA